MSRHIKSIVLLMVFFSSVQAGAQVDFQNEHKFAIDFANVVLQVSKEINEQHPKLKLKDVDRQTFEEIFTEKINKFASLYDESIGLPTHTDKVFKNFNKYFNVTNLYDLFKKMVFRSRVFFRKKSFGIAAAVFMGVTCEYLVPVILVNIGLGVLAPLSPFVPWSVTYMTVPNMIEKLRTKRLVIKALGSKESYLDFKDQIRKVKESLKLETPEHFLFPTQLTDEGTEVIVASRTSWFRSLLGKWGFFQDSISYESLKRFMITNGVSDHYIKYVSDLEVGREVKMTLIIQHILKNTDEDLKLAFRKQFSPHLFAATGVETWDGLFDWTKKAMKINDFNELLKLVQELPVEIDVREVMGIYEHMLLPKYAENFDIGYFEYRKLVRNFEAFKAKIIKSGDLNFGIANREEFTRYLNLSLKNGHLKPCLNSHEQVVNFLIRSVL